MHNLPCFVLKYLLADACGAGLANRLFDHFHNISLLVILLLDSNHSIITTAIREHTIVGGKKADHISRLYHSLLHSTETSFQEKYILDRCSACSSDLVRHSTDPQNLEARYLKIDQNSESE